MEPQDSDAGGDARCNTARNQETADPGTKLQTDLTRDSGFSPARSLELSSICRNLPDVHLPNEPVLNLVNMFYEPIRNYSATQVANRLVHSNSNPAVVFRFKFDWSDMRIHLAPLPRPVISHSGMALNPSAFHSIWPIHILVHGVQNTVEVPLIEERIRSNKQLMIRYRHHFPLALTS